MLLLKYDNMERGGTLSILSISMFELVDLHRVTVHLLTYLFRRVLDFHLNTCWKLEQSVPTHHVHSPHPQCLFSEVASRLSSSGVPSHDFYHNCYSAYAVTVVVFGHFKGELNPKIKLDLNDSFFTLINKYNSHIF